MIKTVKIRPKKIKPKIRKQCICENCGHPWLTDLEMPTVCPKCHSREWNGKKRVGRPPTVEVKSNGNRT